VPPEYPTDRVHRELRQRIEAGEWSPGDRMPAVGALAEQHGTSRNTVSKAIRRLVADGILIVLPNYGTFLC
jgi:DNA-binding GntR family transcriptional regulator